MAYVDLKAVRAGIAETPEASDYTSIQQRITEWRGRQARIAGDTVEPGNAASETENLEKAIVKLLGFRGDGGRTDEAGIPYSTAEYLQIVDWSGRAIVEGKKGSIPEHLPPILKRLSMSPELYLAYIRKPGSGFANAPGALDKLKEYAEYFGKGFLKGQTAATALFSPGQ
jgi:hypothetical protein